MICNCANTSYEGRCMKVLIAIDSKPPAVRVAETSFWNSRTRESRNLKGL